MNCGVLRLSPSALRRSRMHPITTTSVTRTFGHSTASNSSLVTNWPGCSTRYRNTAKVFRRSGTSRVSRQSCSFTGSRRKGGKNKRQGSCITVSLAKLQKNSKEIAEFSPHTGLMLYVERNVPSRLPSKRGGRGLCQNRFLCFLQFVLTLAFS